MLVISYRYAVLKGRLFFEFHTHFQPLENSHDGKYSVRLKDMNDQKGKQNPTVEPFRRQETVAMEVPVPENGTLTMHHPGKDAREFPKSECGFQPAFSMEKLSNPLNFFGL